MTPEERKKRAELRRVARKLENHQRALSGKPPKPEDGVVVVAFLAAVVLYLLRLLLAAWIIFWAVTDITAVGPSFWSILWLIIAAGLLIVPRVRK